MFRVLILFIYCFLNEKPPFFFPSFGLVNSIWICYLFLIHINQNLSQRLCDTYKTDALGEGKWSGWSRGWNKWGDGGLKLYPTLQITLCDSGRMEALLSNLVAQEVWKRLRWCSLVWYYSFTSFLCSLEIGMLAYLLDCGVLLIQFSRPVVAINFWTLHCPICFFNFISHRLVYVHQYFKSCIIKMHKCQRFDCVYFLLKFSCFYYHYL